MGSIGPPRDSQDPSGFELRTPQKKQKLLSKPPPPPQRDEQKSKETNSDSESEDEDGMTAEQKERYLKQVRESENTNYQFVEVLKANSVFCAGDEFYLTFTAKDDVVDADGDQSPVIFQAKVFWEMSCQQYVQGGLSFKGVGRIWL
ncbi:uncharacterized protein LOC130772779 isoform X3 [Actinidia eriantha]|uniref:uncharacterized protein LOC130772779 isoform X3 n=1 Tax=Actinidia eriantha TaxID=165200 RepID=UPI00258708C4|nr:uncharacterized protein LOC130772779 isoform X3 [Actinidia eriantha]